MYSIIQKIYEKNNKVLKERLRNVLKISENNPLKLFILRCTELNNMIYFKKLNFNKGRKIIWIQQK